jgi:hypothetical protein
VCNAGRTFERPRLETLTESGHLADTLGALYAAVGAEQRDPRRVVAAVLEAPQSFDQNATYLALRDRADNSTHDVRFPVEASWQEAGS